MKKKRKEKIAKITENSKGERLKGERTEFVKSTEQKAKKEGKMTLRQGFTLILLTEISLVQFKRQV